MSRFNPILNADAVAVDRELGSRSLHNFLKLTWHLIEPARPFIDNWHIGAICEHMEAFARGEIKRIVITIPPGMSKSVICSVVFPVWVWGPWNHPEKKMIFASYSERVSFRDSRKSCNILRSEWFRARWGDRFKMTSSAVTKYENDRGGFRIATTVAGGVTGEHADYQFVDDPSKPFDLRNAVSIEDNALERAKTWWTETMSTRLMPGAGRGIIMQRLHVDDLAGIALANKEENYEHVNFPMEFEKDNPCITSIIGFKDPRTEEGELLFPERFSEATVATLKRELGPRAASAQLQQRPNPAGGTIILNSYIQHYKKANLPKNWCFLIQSWDCAFKDTKASDFVVGEIWGAFLRADNFFDYYLLAQIRERLSFMKTCKAIKALSKKWPEARTKLIEDKANGPAVIDTLKATIKGMVPIEPEGGKIARVNAIEPIWADGRVFIPDELEAPWVSKFVSELTRFPFDAHDDQVDAMSQSLLWLERKSIATLKRAMSRVR